MEMSGLLHDPDALPLEKGTLQEKNLAPSGYQTQDLFSPFPDHCTNCTVTTDRSACSAVCAAHIFERRQHVLETAENGVCNIICTRSKLLGMGTVTLFAHTFQGTCF